MVALAHIPTAVGVTGRGARPFRRAPTEQRHHRGVEADRSVEAAELVVARHLERCFQEIADDPLQTLASHFDLDWVERAPQRVELVGRHDAVLHLARGVHHREGQVEQVAHLAVAGEQLGGGGGHPHHPEPCFARI